LYPVALKIISVIVADARRTGGPAPWRIPAPPGRALTALAGPVPPPLCSCCLRDRWGPP